MDAIPNGVQAKELHAKPGTLNYSITALIQQTHVIHINSYTKIVSRDIPEATPQRPL